MFWYLELKHVICEETPCRPPLPLEAMQPACLTVAVDVCTVLQHM